MTTRKFRQVRKICIICGRRFQAQPRCLMCSDRCREERARHIARTGYYEKAQDPKYIDQQRLRTKLRYETDPSYRTRTIERATQWRVENPERIREIVWKSMKMSPHRTARRQRQNETARKARLALRALAGLGIQI